MKAIFVQFLSISLFLVLGFSIESKADVSWVNTSGTANINRMIMDICFDSNGNGFVATGGKGVFKTTDKGTSWVQAGSGIGNNTAVKSLLCDEAGNIYAGTSDGSIYISTDAGVSWTLHLTLEGTFNSSNEMLIYDGKLLIVTSKGDVILDGEKIGQDHGLIWTVASKDEYIYIGSMSNGVLRAKGPDYNWAQLNDGLTVTDVHSLVTDANGDLFAGTSGGGIFKLVGSSWVKKSQGLNNHTVLDMMTLSNGALIAGTNAGIYMSEDNGDYWVDISGGTLSSVKVYAVAIDPSSYLFTGDDQGNIYRTESPIIIDVNTLKVNVTPVDKQTYDWGGSVDFFIIVKDGEENPVDGATVAVNNGVDDSEETLTCNADGEALYVYVIPDNTESGDYQFSFVASKDGFDNSTTIIREIAVEHSSGGEGWVKSSDGLPDNIVRALFVKDNGDIIAGPSSMGAYISSNNGQSWVRKSNGLNMVSSVFEFAVNSKGHIMAATDWDGIAITTDNGENWVQSIPDELFGICLAVNNQDHIFASIRNKGIFRSTDDGQNWEQVNNGLDEDLILDIAINQDGKIFAAGGASGVFASEDNGENWTESDNGLSENSVSDLLIDKDGNIFAGTSENGVFRSTDNGESWTATNSDSITARVQVITEGLYGDIFVAAFGLGVFRSFDKGNSWETYNEGFENLGFLDVYSMAVSSDGYIYGGPFPDGVWKREMSVSDVNEQEMGNDGFAMSPNPASDRVRLVYAKESNAKVVVEVMDITGREVFSSEYTINNIDLTFDVSNWSSGIYIVRLSSGKDVLTKLLSVE